MLKARRFIKITLWVLVLGVVALPIGSLAALSGWLAWHGRISIGSASAEPGVSPRFGKSKSKTKKRGKKVDPWRAAPNLATMSLCRTKTASVEGVRYILKQLQNEEAPGLGQADASLLSVVFIPKIAHFLVGDSSTGMTGAMVVSGTRGGLFLKGLPDVSGRTLYHEAIHFNQFVGTEEVQKARMDSLWKVDAKRAFPESDVWDAWGSVKLLAGWRNSETLMEEISDSIRVAWDKKNQPKSPLVLTRNTLFRVLQQPRYAPVRQRLTLISQVRRGIAGDKGDLTWAEEVSRLLVFETEASAMGSWCHNATAKLSTLPPAVVKAERAMGAKRPFEYIVDPIVESVDDASSFVWTPKATFLQKALPASF